MQDTMWIRERIDEYERFFKELMDEGKKLRRLKDIQQTSSGLAQIENRTNELLEEYHKRLDTEENSFIGGIKKHAFRRKIALLEEYLYEVRLLYATFKELRENS